MTPKDDPRRPGAFDLDDPNLSVAPEPPRVPPPRRGTARAEQPSDATAPDTAASEDLDGVTGPAAAGAATTGTGRRIGGGLRWGALFLAAAGALASLAFALSFARFVSIAFERQDWLGWTAFGLGIVLVGAGAMIVLREAVGFWRLRRLARVRAEAESALARGDLALERRTVERIVEPLKARPELSWPLARLAEHAAGVHDAGDLFRLADRDVLMPLDGEARRLVAAAARRVGIVSAMSPMALVTVGWVLVENLRLLRGLAALYGGRPGFVGTARLARLVILHIVATGGIALTDDLIGQFIGQDLLRRLSRRLGESVFNAALTARVGAAAITVIRPLPFIEAPPVRARDFLAEITRRTAPARTE